MAHELIHLRVGPWIFHTDAIVLPLAGIVFALLAYRALHPSLVNRRVHAWLVVAVLSLGGVIGARLYGLVLPFYTGGPVLSDGAWRALRFGSMGGIFGILFAAYGAAILSGRLERFSITDTVVPAVCVSAAIARVSCVFQGCCAGISTGPLAAIANPIYAWPVLDIAALLFALGAVNATFVVWPVQGGRTIVFLLVYGVLRFAVESLRDTYTVGWGVTWAQCLVTLQVGIGIFLAGIWVAKHRDSRTYVFR